MITPHIGVNIGYNAHAAETLERGHDIDPSNVQQFAGKTILVVGSGIQCWEDYYLTQFDNLDTRIINLDPLYSHWYRHQDKQLAWPRSGHMVSAAGQAIPLRDQTVGAVFSSWSMPLVFADECLGEASARMHMDELACELFRVLQPGGTISLEPIHDPHEDPQTAKGMEKNAVDCFTEAGFDCTTSTLLIDYNGDTHVATRLNGIKQS